MQAQCFKHLQGTYDFQNQCHLWHANRCSGSLGLASAQVAGAEARPDDRYSRQARAGVACPGAVCTAQRGCTTSTHSPSRASQSQSVLGDPEPYMAQASVHTPTFYVHAGLTIKDKCA
eukprot:365681-Chlamydomonas_euryale.AAC.2